MLNNSYFRHRLLRKYIVAFGNLFNDIMIVRYDQDQNPIQQILVPLSYANKEKFIVREEQNPILEAGNVSVVAPRMAFSITGFMYDGDRKLGNKGFNSIRLADGDFNTQINPVPYDIMLQLSILVDNHEDGQQIIEQILPFFVPDFTVTVETIPEMKIEHDIPIILNNISSEDNYDTPFQEKRQIIWTLEYTMKAYFYGPVKNRGAIKRTQIDFHLVNEFPVTIPIRENSPRAVRVKEEVVPPTAAPSDPHEIVKTVESFEDGKIYDPISDTDVDPPIDI